MNNYLDFITDDVKTGMLKLGRVGMIRRTLKFKDGVRFEDFLYLPLFDGFVVLRGKGRFEG